MSEHAAAAARLLVENETLRAEVEQLRDEATRLSALNRALRAQLSIADAELTRLRAFASAIEHSKPWRAVQALRAAVGRRW